MNNSEIKRFSKLKNKKFRDAEGLFIVEGLHSVNEIIHSKYYSNKIRHILISDKFGYDFDIPNNLKNKTEIISDIKLRKLCDTVTPQGIICIAEKNSSAETTRPGKITVILDGINDPGNMGTIIRTCYFFGIETIYLSYNCTDIFNQKVIRATQGAIFNISILTIANLKNKIIDLINKEYKIILTIPDALTELGSIQLDKMNDYCIVFGNEAKGISDDIKNIKGVEKVSIKKFSNCESLNVSVSAGIFLHQICSKIM